MGKKDTFIQNKKYCKYCNGKKKWKLIEIHEKKCLNFELKIKNKD